MKTQHTSGEWKASEPSGTVGILITTEGCIKTSVAAAMPQNPMTECVANAQLIAAAPNLLKAHHEIRKTLSEFTGGNLEFLLATLDKISSNAISKAINPTPEVRG